MSYKKVLFTNFLSLSTVQIANYLLPLITIPYIVRVIGPEKFGMINFAQAFISYFVVLTNFGINLIGAREIATIRDDIDKLSDVFSAFIFGRLYLSIIATIIFSILLIIIPKLSADYLLFIITFVVILTDIFCPVWFFQGMEKMQYIALINLIGKGISTVLIFLIIKQANDYLYIPMLNVITSIIIGFISLFIIYKKFDLKFIIPEFQFIYSLLKKSFTIFISDVYVTFYTTSYPVILGFITNYTYVGYYTAAHKIIQAWLGLQNLVVTTTFPNISRLANHSKDKALIFFKRMTVICLIVSIPASIFIFFYADDIVELVLGSQFYSSVIVVKIMSILFVLILMNLHFTFQGMLPFRYDKYFNYARLIGGIIAICLVIPLSFYWKHIGTSFTFVISELGVFVASIYLLKNAKIEFLERQQFKKIAFFTVLVFFTVILSMAIKNYFAGIAISCCITLFAIYKIFGKEYIIRRADV